MEADAVLSKGMALGLSDGKTDFISNVRVRALSLSQATQCS